MVWVRSEPNTKKGGDEVNISKTTGCLFRYVGLGCWLAVEVTHEPDTNLWGSGPRLLNPSRLTSVFWINVSKCKYPQSRDIPEIPPKMKQDESKRAISRDGQVDRQDIAVGGLLNMGRVADELSAE